MTSSEIRQSFLDFFAARNHHVVPSAPVVPHGDPTLLFTNAGMNQFKDVFLGTGTRNYARAVDTQKCIRVSGKHNDLEEVGYDTYHHTFFEMLGNWSFGDYFKEDALSWSWELLTKVWGLPADRLHATVYRTDDEAYEIWKKYLPESQIHRFDEKDNFWEMGETGPCGPCSEIHYDRTPDKSGGSLVNAGVPEVMEIWNNVFMQFNRLADGTLVELPKKHVDTGMGFERIVAVLQNKDSNYDTDVFQPIITLTEKLSGKNYEPALESPVGVAMRVIADHVRTLAFAIADGAIPGNDGRGYVLRRILRRAARYARNIGLTEPVLYKHVDVLVRTMGAAFPELREQQGIIERIMKAEEESFLVTLDKGLARFENLGNEISAQDAFELFDTFGFPLDLTELLAKERGSTVDTAGFEVLLNQQRERSRAARKNVQMEVESISLNTTTEFVGYTESTAQTTIEYVDGNQVVLAATPMYAEMGGQQADHGTIIVGGTPYNVVDVRKAGAAIVHVCDTEVAATVGEPAFAEYNRERRQDISREHTATHIMHEALRQVLGTHVQQSGSLVTPQHLRFDFSHFEKMKADEIQAVEDLVNQKIFEAHEVVTEDLPIELARTVPNVKMFFGDKYGSSVRVVTIDPGFSSEFCGGTHVRNSSELGVFKILTESSVASGIRRIDAIVGRSIPQHISQLIATISASAQEQQALKDKISKLEKELQQTQTETMKQQLISLVEQAETIGQYKLASGIVKGASADQLKDLADSLRNMLKTNGIGVLASVVDDKVQLVCVVTDDATSKHKAGAIVGAIAKELGGGGGGKPHMATAGAKDVANLATVMSRLSQFIPQ